MTITRFGRTLWKIENTMRHLGVEVDDAFVPAVKIDVKLALATVCA